MPGTISSDVSSPAAAASAASASRACCSRSARSPDQGVATPSPGCRSVPPCPRLPPWRLQHGRAAWSGQALPGPSADIGHVPASGRGSRRWSCRADQLADLAVADLGMVADDPVDPVGLVLALADRRVTRATGAADLVRLLVHLERIIGVSLALFDCLVGQFTGADRVAAGQLGRGGVVSDRLDLKNMKPAELGDLLEGQRCILDQPGSGRASVPRPLKFGMTTGRPLERRTGTIAASVLEAHRI